MPVLINFACSMPYSVAYFNNISALSDVTEMFLIISVAEKLEGPFNCAKLFLWKQLYNGLTGNSDSPGFVISV